jgi:GNAT superfamily N-acetyltransferase
MFDSGLRVVDLEIGPKYLGRGVASALFRRLENVVRTEHFGHCSLRVALVTASVNLKAAAVPLLMACKQVGFSVVRFDGQQDRVDMRWDLRDPSVSEGQELPNLWAYHRCEIFQRSHDIMSAVQEGEQLGFFIPVAARRNETLADYIPHGQVRLLRFQSAIGTEGFIVLRLTPVINQRSGFDGQRGDVLQMGFHPLRSLSYVQMVAQELLRKTSAEFPDMADFCIPGYGEGEIISKNRRAFLENLKVLGFEDYRDAAGRTHFVHRIRNIPRKPR